MNDLRCALALTDERRVAFPWLPMGPIGRGPKNAYRALAIGCTIGREVAVSRWHSRRPDIGQAHGVQDCVEAWRPPQ
jgi:hypothetical protein